MWLFGLVDKDLKKIDRKSKEKKKVKEDKKKF
ncbi:unnamed protein product, partial [marine sediment metagenome]